MKAVLPVPTVLLLASLILLAITAGSDLKDRRIPNELAAAVAAIGLIQGRFDKTRGALA